MSLFSQHTRLLLLSLGAIELASLLSNWYPLIGSIFFVVILVVTFLVSIKWPMAGVSIALIELVIGSKGHLFNISIGGHDVGIRIGLFVVVMTAWLLRALYTRKTALFGVRERWWLVAMAVVILGGLVNALRTQQSYGLIFADGNAWIFFAYIAPWIDAVRDEKQRQWVIQLFLTAALWVIIKTIFLFYVFSHNFPMPRDMYKWVRDTGFGEIAQMKPALSRIFSQSHIYAIIAGIIWAFTMWRGSNEPKATWSWPVVGSLLGAIAVTIVSLSRSNWLGAVVALAVGSVVMLMPLMNRLWRKLISFREILARQAKPLMQSLGTYLAVGAGSLLLLLGIFLFPWPDPSAGNINAMSDVFQSRFAMNEAGAASRWSQLPDLKAAVWRHAIIGSGWGTTVTYRTYDPRIVSQFPDGMYTTYAFEWGYLDIILKIGIVGLVIYLGFLGTLLWHGWQYTRGLHDRTMKQIYAGLLVGLLVIMVTHMFSPYLNHPIGIGYILLLMVLIQPPVLQKPA